jgi:hypothetical protein
VRNAIGFMPIAVSSTQGDGFVYSIAVFLEALSWPPKAG